MGASGWVMVWHAFGISTSKMALRLIFFRFDLEPNVATSLEGSAWQGLMEVLESYQTVATPYFRDVRTGKRFNQKDISLTIKERVSCSPS